MSHRIKIMNRVHIFSIEGNIGSGKSTCLKYLKENYHELNAKIVFVDEPVSCWENIKDANGKNMIEKFYDDPTKYSFPFQIMALTSRFINLNRSIKNALKDNSDDKPIIIITERSLHTDCHVFAELLKKQGKIEDVCFQIYMQLYNEYHSNFPVDTIIYINTTPEICSERIKKRSRLGEEVIPLDYLIQCHEEHNTFVYEKMNVVNKIIIDGMCNLYENPNIVNEWVLKVEERLNEVVS